MRHVMLILTVTFSATILFAADRNPRREKARKAVLEQYDTNGTLIPRRGPLAATSGAGSQKPRARKQGILVTTGSPNVEVWVDGESRGKHATALLELPPGYHVVRGTRDGYYG